MLKINLLFLLFCLPIVTISGSTIALMTVTHRMALDEAGDAVSEFWRVFKKSWKRTILSGLYFPLVQIIMIYAIWYVSGNYTTYIKIFLLALIFTSFILHTFATYYFYLLVGISTVQSEQRLKPFSESFAWSIAGFKENCLLFILELLLFVIQIELFPWGLFILLCGGFAWAAFIRSYLIKKIIYL